MHGYEFQTQGTCSKYIRFGIDDGKLYGLQFYGGCPGNLQALSTLLEGADAAETAEKLRGNRCGNKPTSCADQLAIALSLALEREQDSSQDSTE